MSSQVFEQALLAVDRATASKVLHNAHTADGSYAVVEEIVVPALERIGDLWEAGHASLSQVYMSGRICEELVTGLLQDNQAHPVPHPPMAIAVMDDYHMLGKRIINSTVRSAGYTLRDYGRIQADALVQRLQEDQIAIALVSSLMLRSALQIERVRSQIEQLGLPTRVLVGGAPFRFDKDLWQEVGAHAVGYTIQDALHVLKQWTEQAA